jgi:hypothetical protein
VTPAAVVFLVGVVEYVLCEILTNASRITIAKGRHQITTGDIHCCIYGDRFLNPNLRSKSEKKRGLVETNGLTCGDEDMRRLAQSVHWGDIKIAYKGLYTNPSSASSVTDSSSKKAKITPSVSSPLESIPAAAPENTTVAVA